MRRELMLRWCQTGDQEPCFEGRASLFRRLSTNLDANLPSCDLGRISLICPLPEMLCVHVQVTSPRAEFGIVWRMNNDS